MSGLCCCILLFLYEGSSLGVGKRFIGCSLPVPWTREVPDDPFGFDNNLQSKLKTSAHFLIGEPLTAPPDNNIIIKRLELVSRLKHVFGSNAGVDPESS